MIVLVCNVVAIGSISVIAHCLLTLIESTQVKVFLKVGNCDLNVLKLLRRVYAGVTCTATTMILSTIVYTLKLIEKMNPHPTYQSAQLGFSIASSISAVVTAVIWLLAISLFIRQLPNMMDVKPTSVNSINYTVNESKLFLYNVLLGAQTMSNRTFSAFQRPRDLQNFLDSAQLFHASLSFETAQASSTSTACEVNTQSSSSHMHGAATAPTENISTTAHDGLACATQAVPGAAEEPKLTQKVFDSMMKESEEQGCVNTAKLQYLSCIAHELRTPLQSLCYTLDLLLLTKLPADNSATMNQALVAVDLMKASISQTMDVGKVLSGVKLAPRLAIVSLSTIIAKVEFMIDAQRKQEVPVSIEVETGICDEIITEEEWLWQMLLNLLTNACKYTDRGSITVKVSLIDKSAKYKQDLLLHNETSAEKKMLLFEVIDTGVGVSNHQLNGMFDAFAQVQDGQVTGTGLGLFAVRTRAKGLQGTCGARHNTESPTGTGTVMWFAIPHLSEGSRCGDDLSENIEKSDSSIRLRRSVIQSAKQ